MSELSTLVNRRGQIKGQVTRFQTYIKSISADVDIDQIKIRRDKLEEAWNEFSQIQAAIVNIESDSNEHTEYENDFETLYFDTVSACSKLLSANKPEFQATNSAMQMCDIGISSSALSNTSSQYPTSVIKLAPLNVPEFTGNYQEWTTFHDMFVALIHSNKSLMEVQKFFYLKSALTGDAQNVIKSLETTAQNYEVAWSTLVERYNNKRYLVQNHTHSIFNLEPIQKESSVKLRQLADAINGHMKALDALGQNTKNWGSLLVHLISTKLDVKTIREWETKSITTDVPKVDELLQFLENRIRILESVESAKVSNSRVIQKKSGNASIFVSTNEFKCFICKLSHSIYKCPTFLSLSITDRIQRTKELKLCKNCLRQHLGKQCTSRNCFKCNKPHNSLLHLTQKINSNQTENNQEKKEEIITEPTTSINAHILQKKYNQIILGTAIVRVQNKKGSSILCRVLLDSGSQNNFVREEIAQILGIKRKTINYSITGIQQSKHTATSSITVQINSRVSDYQATVDCIVLSNLTNNIPTTPIDPLKIKIPNNIELADPSFVTPQQIDMIIGAGMFFDILCDEKLKPELDGPYYQKTLLGWVVAGKVQCTLSNNTSVALLSINENNEIKLVEQIAKFWRIEECSTINEVYSLDEKICKNHFENTVVRGSDGKFIVKLPLRDTCSNLGNSYDRALQRFYLLEKRFKSNPDLKFEYTKFIKEYYELSHMEKCEHNQIENIHYFLPHHAVFKKDSATTKTRVVFDGSFKTTSGLSLNDVLFKGPNVQQELIYILARFRTHKYALTADISKMYRQVWIDKCHRKYQKIIWREESDKPIMHYQLKTVTYGTTPASFLSTACLNKLAETESTVYPEACAALKRDFCVDDYLGGASTVEKAILLRNQLITLLKGAGFELRKWTSNNSDLLRDMPNKEKVHMQVLDLKDNITKILGLIWNTKNDTFKYNITNIDQNKVITKRTILSLIATIFDPLGLIGPVVVLAKLLMQEIWRLRIDWDSELPEKYVTDWQNYKKKLDYLNNLNIPRRITELNEVKYIQIHGFSDASITSYGACIYIRTKSSSGKCDIKLLCAKSKIAPLKIITLPRLELCAALLLARMSSKFIPKLNLKIDSKHYWTDSSVTLSWISSPSAKWKTFVAHRVGEIQDLTLISEWGHVRTHENPADIISRGCCPTKLPNENLWWNGPEWLRCEPQKWPKFDRSSFSEFNNTHEIKQSIVLNITVQAELFILGKYSSYFKLIRITAYILRFAYNIKMRKDNTNDQNKMKLGPLQSSELENATFVIIKCIQNQYWSTEIQLLQNNKSIKGKLFPLRPYIDDIGLLRVGGRLKNAIKLNTFQRNPILLPQHSTFTKLLFKSEHEKIMHGGPQALLSTIRLKYWPINGRNIARNTVHKCVQCFKAKPTFIQPIMGNLPKDRVEPSRPFLKSGVDFAGPIMIRTSLRRNAPLVKGYICVFVCFCTKAIHIELVGDLTTESFLNALRRFISRRGMITDIYSDNATNFVGANKQLKEVYDIFHSNENQKFIMNATTNIGIQWHFSPPRTPNFGGLWESAIKSIKHHLYRVLGNASLTFEEMNTVLVKIEACLNSRPITPLSSDPSDLSYLTPGHFLIGESFMAFPEPDLTSTPMNRLSRWRRVSQLYQQIWKYWYRDYLNQFQERRKWQSTKGSKIKVGTIVMVREDNLPPLQWRIARVKEVNFGDDGEVRVATVAGQGWEYKRGVRNLCPLPFEEN